MGIDGFIGYETSINVLCRETLRLGSRSWLIRWYDGGLSFYEAFRFRRTEFVRICRSTRIAVTQKYLAFLRAIKDC